MTIRRVLVAPLNYSHRQEGQYQAFREVFGDGVQEFDYMHYVRQDKSPDKKLIAAAEKFSPDWIWLQLQNSEAIRPETLAELRRRWPRCLVTHWMGDCRPQVASYLASVCRETHGTLISSVGQIPLYRAVGAPRVTYCQIGLDTAADLDGIPPWDPSFRVPEVVFCGGYYGHVAEFARGTAQRLATLTALTRAGLDVGVVGGGWPSDIRTVGECHVKQQHHVYRRAKVVVAVNHFNDVDRYYSDRLLIAMASGTPVVAWHVPGLEHEFTNMLHLILATSEADFVDRVKWLLAHPAEAAAIGRAGREKAARDHTWTARIRQILPTVEGWREEACHA